jgi:hypothetical protein
LTFALVALRHLLASLILEPDILRLYFNHFWAFALLALQCLCGKVFSTLRAHRSIVFAERAFLRTFFMRTASTTSPPTYLPLAKPSHKAGIHAALIPLRPLSGVDQNQTHLLPCQRQRDRGYPHIADMMCSSTSCYKR